MFYKHRNWNIKCASRDYSLRQSRFRRYESIQFIGTWVKYCGYQNPDLFHIAIYDLDVVAQCNISRSADDIKWGAAADTPMGCVAIQISTCWRNRMTGTSWRSPWRNADSAPRKGQLHAPIYAGCHPDEKQLCRNEPGDPGGCQAGHEPKVCLCHLVCHKGTLMVIWAALDKALSAVWRGELSFSSGHSQTSGFSAGLSDIQCRATKRMKQLEHLNYEERLQELEEPQHREEEAQGSSSNLHKHLKGGCKEDWARLFSVIPSTRTRSNGHKPKHRRFPLSTRRYVYTMWTIEHWLRLPRKAYLSFFLMTCKSCLGMVLDNLFQVRNSSFTGWWGTGTGCVEKLWMP